MFMALPILFLVAYPTVMKECVIICLVFLSTPGPKSPGGRDCDYTVFIGICSVMINDQNQKWDNYTSPLCLWGESEEEITEMHPAWKKNTVKPTESDTWLPTLTSSLCR